MSTEFEHRMRPADDSVAGVSVGGETYYRDEASGHFVVPAEVAARLAAEGWETVTEAEADAEPEKPKRTRARKADTTSEAAATEAATGEEPEA